MESKVDNLGKAMDEISLAMFGSDGDKGLLTRTALIEDSLGRVAISQEKTADQLEQLVILVREHHADKSIHTVWGMFTSSWKVPAALMFGFIVLHMIATYVPNFINFFLAIFKLPLIQLQ
jgi:hypothetical protein